MTSHDPSAESALFGSDLWQAALEKYAAATRLTVTLFDADARAVFGPVHSTPLFQLFDEAGYDPGIVFECARRCIAQTGKRPPVFLAQFHGLAVVGASLVLEDQIVGAAVGGYAFADFFQASDVQQLARQSGIAFDRVWEIARKQPPVPRQRLTVHGELLQVLGDALLRENYRLRQYERAAAIVNSSDDAIISKDCNGVITSWNKGAERLFGYPAQEAIGQSVTMLIPPDRQHEEPEILARIARGELIDHFETVRLRKDGSLLDVSLTISPIKDSAGRIIGASKIARDITGPKRAEEALRASEEGYRTLVAQVKDYAIFSTDIAGRATSWNEGVKRILGFNEQEFIGEDIVPAIFTPEDVRAGVADRELREAAGKGSASDDRWLQRKDGSRFFAQGTTTALKDASGAVIGFSKIFRDTTRQKEAEDALRQTHADLRGSEERLRLATGAAEIGLWDVDTINDRLFWPARVKAMFGISADVPVSMADFYAGLHPDDRESTSVAFAAAIDPKKRAFYDVEYRTVGKEDGVIRWVAAKGRGTFDNGVCVRIVGTAVEITERKRAEAHREMLINELNHRVKNTLATVQSFASQTLRNARSTAEARDMFDSRLSALAKAHDVLTRESWAGAGLNEVVSDAIAPYSEDGRGPRFQVSGPELRLQPKSALALSMALHELATNAVKHGALSNGTGAVEIGWRIAQGDPQHFRFRWAESGGPPVEKPRRRGFGSRLVEQGLAQDLAGEVRLEFEQGGLICTVDAPLAEVADDDQRDARFRRISE